MDATAARRFVYDVFTNPGGPRLLPASVAKTVVGAVVFFGSLATYAMTTSTLAAYLAMAGVCLGGVVGAIGLVGLGLYAASRGITRFEEAQDPRRGGPQLRL
jgi:hypothetical protein